jgi:hypothetical protein
MAVLHEVLAVEKDLEQVASKVVGEAVITFSKKVDHFTGHVKSLEMYDVDRKKEEEGQKEVKELTTTVPEKLSYIAEHLIRFYDALAQKEATNQEARSDVILPDGTILLKALPATLLLGLENKLARLREMYDTIPTLQPGVEWKPDPQAKFHGVYRAITPTVNLKSEKDFSFRVLYAATKEHPAQIEKWNVDKPIGQYKTERSSGMLAPIQKSNLLGKLDTLIAAIKQARMRANTVEVKKLEVGKVIFGFLHEEL